MFTLTLVSDGSSASLVWKTHGRGQNKQKPQSFNWIYFLFQSVDAPNDCWGGEASVNWTLDSLIGYWGGGASAFSTLDRLVG